MSDARSSPISLFGRLNAAVLLAIMPEYPKFRAARRGHAGRPEARPSSFSIQPEVRRIAGVEVRCAEAGKADGPVVLLLNPLPQSILAFDPIWGRLAEHCRLVALDPI